MSERFEASMTAEELRLDWQPVRVGRRIEVFAEVESTNTTVFSLVGEPDADGLVVFADYQTAGRGRLGRKWAAPRRAGVLCSVLLLESVRGKAQQKAGMAKKKPATGEYGGWLTLAAAVAVCRGIRGVTEVTPAIKWPNDLRYRGKKLGGILIESRMVSEQMQAWVVGIGINCHQRPGHFPPEIRQTATSLDMVASHPIDSVAVARSLLRALDEVLAGPSRISQGELHGEWMTYAEPIGTRVWMRHKGIEYAGRTVLVELGGGLVVQCDDGVRRWFDPMYTSML